MRDGVFIPSRGVLRAGRRDSNRAGRGACPVRLGTLPHCWADHDFYLRAQPLGTPLYVASRAFVDIDSTRTTSAERPETLSWSAFLHTLCDTRSHRNLRDVTALFRKHDPIPGRYPLGVTLYTGRYLLVYPVKRAGYLLGVWQHDRRRMR